MEPKERIELSSRRYEGRRPSRDLRQVGGGTEESNPVYPWIMSPGLIDDQPSAIFELERPVGIEPTHTDFADLRLPICLRTHGGSPGLRSPPFWVSSRCADLRTPESRGVADGTRTRILRGPPGALPLRYSHDIRVITECQASDHGDQLAVSGFVLATGIEPVTTSLSWRYATAAPSEHVILARHRRGLEPHLAPRSHASRPDVSVPLLTG